MFSKTFYLKYILDFLIFKKNPYICMYACVCVCVYCSQHLKWIKTFHQIFHENIKQHNCFQHW